MEPEDGTVSPRPTLRLLSEIAEDISKEHYLNAAYKAAELQLRLLRLLSGALKNPPTPGEK